MQTTSTVPTVTQPSWNAIVQGALRFRAGAARLRDLYRVVEQLEPGKVARNPHYKNKVRAVVGRLAKRGVLHRVDRGVWEAVA